jgi:hypothetical protein
MSPSNQHHHNCHAVEELKSSKHNIPKLFLSHELADIAFRAKEQFFPAHRAFLECFAPELAELSESFDKHHPMPIEEVDPQTFKLMLGHVYGISLDTIDWKSQATYLLDPAKKTESRRQIRLHHSQGRSRSMVCQIPQS